MFRKCAMVAAVMIVCMPIGGLTASGPAPQTHVVATAEPVDQPWLVAPARLLFLCAVLLVMAKVDYARLRRCEIAMEG